MSGKNKRINAWDLAAAQGRTHCPLCQRVYRQRREGMSAYEERRGQWPTRDHIMPRERLGPHVAQYARLARNIRVVCCRCNVLRAVCGHCDAVVMAVLAVARKHSASPFTVARMWGFQVREDRYRQLGRIHHRSGVYD